MGGPLATLFVVGSAASTLLSGVSEYGQSRSESRQMRMQAQAEELKGRQEVIAVQTELLRTLASNAAATGASGTMMSGDPLRAQSASMREAQKTSNVIALNADMAATGLRAQAYRTKQAGKISLLKSVIGAGTNAAKNKLEINR